MKNLETPDLLSQGEEIVFQSKLIQLILCLGIRDLVEFMSLLTLNFVVYEAACTELVPST